MFIDLIAQAYWLEPLVVQADFWRRKRGGDHGGGGAEGSSDDAAANEARADPFPPPPPPTKRLPADRPSPNAIPKPRTPRFPVISQQSPPVGLLEGSSGFGSHPNDPLVRRRSLAMLAGIIIV